MALEISIIYNDNYYCDEMIVKMDGILLAQESDGGQPEDATFTRDWNWVAPLLKKIYKLAYDKGRREGWDESSEYWAGG